MRRKIAIMTMLTLSGIVVVDLAPAQAAPSAVTPQQTAPRTAAAQPRYEAQDKELLNTAQAQLVGRPDLNAIFSAGLVALRCGDEVTAMGRALQALTLARTDSESLHSGMPLLSEINSKMVNSKRFSQSFDLLDRATRIADARGFLLTSLTAKQYRLVTDARKGQRDDYSGTLTAINKGLEPLLTRKLSVSDAENLTGFMITCPIFVDTGAGILFANESEAGPALPKFRELVKLAKHEPATGAVPATAAEKKK